MTDKELLLDAIEQAQRKRCTYPPEAKVLIHEDHWRWGPRRKFTFREHAGRGYWKGDT
jgi:hypothetical protein